MSKHPIGNLTQIRQFIATQLESLGEFSRVDDWANPFRNENDLPNAQVYFTTVNRQANQWKAQLSVTILLRQDQSDQDLDNYAAKVANLLAPMTNLQGHAEGNVIQEINYIRDPEFPFAGIDISFTTTIDIEE